MPEENQPLSRNEITRLRALYAGKLSPEQAEELNAVLFEGGIGRVVSDSNYSLGIATAILDVVRNQQLSSNDLFSAAIRAANEERIEDARTLASDALDLVDPGSSEAGAIYVFIAQLNLQQGNLQEFKQIIDEQRKNALVAIPLWKRLGDLGILFYEDDVVPPEAIEEVFQLALDEFHSTPTKKRSFSVWLKQIRTKLFPALFNFIPYEYDEVRLNLLLATAARRQRHYRRAINHLENAKTACDEILVEKQAEYAKFLSDYSFQKLLLCSALGNWKGMNAVVGFTKRSLTLAGFNKHFPRSGFDYNTIDRNYIISAYVFSSRSTKPEKIAWIVDSLQSILDRIDREVDGRCMELAETIQADLEMIHTRQVEFEILPLVSLKIA